MAYGAQASRISSVSSNLESKSSSLESVNFDSSWEGNACNIQMEHRTELSSAIKKVVADMKSLSEAMQLIEQYDSFKTQKEKWESRLNSLPADEVANISEARANFTSASTKMRETRDSIRSKLDSISASYSSNISIIPVTEVVTTNDVFANVFTSSTSVSQAFDVAQYVQVSYNDNPNFNNTAAWVSENPYSQAGLYGQCTWFAWGKFYEMYGYSPGFTGNGKDCAYQLANAHPDKFEISSQPKTGAVFSYQGYPYGHTGVITEVKDGMLTYQDGNYDNVTNTFADAQHDWGTKTMSVNDFINRYGGAIVFANPVSV